MLHTSEALVTVPVDEQRDLIALHPMTFGPMPWWRPSSLLRFLQTFVTAWISRRSYESLWISPDLPQWETPTENLARQHTYLYINSLSG
jgi:hypothetical protein